MKRAVIVVIILALAAAGWYAYSQYTAQQQALADEKAALESAQAEDLSDLIWASGKLQPDRWAGLSPAQSGLVAAIHVSEGQSVKAGDLLLELERASLAAQVGVAQAAVTEAEAARAKLLAGATEAQIASAEADVASAEAGVALAAGQLLVAQSAVETARAQQTIAERQYGERASHPTEAELTTAEAQVAVAEAAVEQAQAAFNMVRGDPNIGALPQSMVLRQATASLEAAMAEAAQLTQGATPEQLSVLSGQIDAAAAQVSAAESQTPGAEAAVLSALSRQASAQAALDVLVAGATAEDIAMAEARVDSANAALASAQAALDQAQIAAPFDGQVGQINVRPGEMTTPGQILILLGDPSAMHVETTDLRETDVVRLSDGMQVEVTFDALPERFFTGTITRVAPVSTAAQGSTNYTIHVKVDDLDASLRWGMTAFVNIEAD